MYGWIGSTTKDKNKNKNANNKTQDARTKQYVNKNTNNRTRTKHEPGSDTRWCDPYGADRLIQVTEIWMTPLLVKEDKSG